MDPIWMVHISRDGGRTWALEQPYRLYKSHDRAVRYVSELNMTGTRLKFKLVEYRPRPLMEEL